MEIYRYPQSTDDREQTEERTNGESLITDDSTNQTTYENLLTSEQIKNEYLKINKMVLTKYPDNEIERIKYQISLLQDFVIQNKNRLSTAQILSANNFINSLKNKLAEMTKAKYGTGIAGIAEMIKENPQPVYAGIAGIAILFLISKVG